MPKSAEGLLSARPGHSAVLTTLAETDIAAAALSNKMGGKRIFRFNA